MHTGNYLLSGKTFNNNNNINRHENSEKCIFRVLATNPHRYTSGSILAEPTWSSGSAPWEILLELHHHRMSFCEKPSWVFLRRTWGLHDMTCVQAPLGPRTARATLEEGEGQTEVILSQSATFRLSMLLQQQLWSSSSLPGSQHTHLHSFWNE